MALPLKYTTEGVPKNWDGKDWPTYKWAMSTVFQEKKLTDIVEGTITRSMLSDAHAEEEFDHNQTKILRLVGTSVPPDILHQIRDKMTGTEMWNALCDLYEGRANKAVMAHRIRSLRNDIWSTKLNSGGDVNKHLSKISNLRTELASLQYTVEDTDMVEILLESLPNQSEFESMKAAIRYSPDFGIFTPSNVRDMIRAADSRQKEFRTKDGGNHRGSQKSGGNLANAKEKEDTSTKNGRQGQDVSKNSSKKKKPKKCYICESTEHLKAECPERSKTQVSGGAATTETKRKPRGNVTLLQRTSSTHVQTRPAQVNVEGGVVSGSLSAMMFDAGVEAEVNEHKHEDPGVDNQDDENAEIGEFTDTSGGWWFFDTAADMHLTGNRSYYVAFTEDTSESQSVHGVTPAMASRITGVGTVAVVTEVDGERVVFYLNDVFYVPGAEHSLFSPGLAAEQGFVFDYEQETRTFRVQEEGRTVFVAAPYESTWDFFVNHPEASGIVVPQNGRLCNFTTAEGVASLQLWHERLAHTCPQYLKTMVDKDLVCGMMLRQRQLGDCEACHIAKQKKKPHKKKIDRKTKVPNQTVYVDLLIPSKDNGTKYEAVLVIMDGYSRFVTVHLLTSKLSAVINNHIKKYVMWAERQAGRRNGNEGRIKYMVQQVLSDKGGEFVNQEMKSWYSAHGIEHVLVGPKSSQLNLCERTHQSIMEMTKAMMHQSGFPKNLWPEALKNAVYIKNRVFNKGTQGIPYQMMFGIKPDIHHIRKFGTLAYVHVPVSPGRRKHHDNAKIGFVLGCAEDVVGCKVYFPDERTAKFVSDLRVAEEVTYKDRHAPLSAKDEDLESLHFEAFRQTTASSDGGSDADVSEPTVDAAIGLSETMALASMSLERGADCAAPVVDDTSQERDDNYKETCEATLAQIEGVTVQLPSVRTAVSSVRISESNEREMERQVVDDSVKMSSPERLSSPCENAASQTTVTSWDASDSVVGECGSLMDYDELGDDEVNSYADAEVDESVTVASMVALDESDHVELDDMGEIADTQPYHEVFDASAFMQQNIGKRTQREETQSEELRVERSAEKQEPKRTRTGLRECHERRRPSYLDDYVVNVVQHASRVLDKNGRPIRASNVKIPKNHREAMRSGFADFWRQGELEEMAALRMKGVIEEIAVEDVPKDAKPINTRWVYALKSDHQGYVIRFKTRIVALGNYQRPGIDFRETFSPVARMSSFRMMIALAAVLNLLLYGGDINTAYLNAVLGIRQYLRSIDGFPSKIDGHMYVVVKALYGLRQSGREWNSELNDWLLEHGYQRSMTEPCLYYCFDSETTILVLIYVDDIMVATNDESKKENLFKELNEAYGIKDQGLLTEYLGIEVEQTGGNITIRQSKYAREILKTFGYDQAHAVGNPMETNARLVPLADDDETDTSFEYRKAIGMLMYLATGTRPDLAYAVGQLSRFVGKPSAKHVGALKRVLRYLTGTVEHGITYDRSRQDDIPSKIVLEGCCDSDWANDPESRKSTTGFVFKLAGGAVSWMSRRQSIVALSTAEAEYVAACEATMEAVASSNILQEILPKKEVELRLGIDNQAAHVLATNPTYSRRTRHIELRWHFVREQVQKGTIVLHKINGNDNPADAFTKPLDKQRLKTLLMDVGIGLTKN